MEQRQKKARFNIVDIIAVALIIAALAFVGYKLVNRGAASGEEAATTHITYTYQVEGVDPDVYESAKTHLPSRLMASGTLYDGQIEAVEKKPYYVLAANGQWVEDPYHVTLVFTVTCNVPKGEVMTTKIGDQEVRVGKTDYILKSEYIEFSTGGITSVTWDD